MRQAVKTMNSFFARDVITTAAITVLYLLLSAVLIGFKTEQLVLAAIFNLLYYISPGTRKLITGFSIFIIYWIVFDYMKAFPNYRFNPVHIESLYNAEKNLFGISYHGQILTPNEFWLLHTNSFLDVATGVFYLCWIPVPLAFAAYLFYKNRGQFLQFSLTFFLVNLLGFIIYYVYPAAPPWYIQQHGLDFIPGIPGNTAGLQHFDDFFQVSIFKSLYAKSSNVFAAMPSLHSSYPVIVLYYGVKNKLGEINIFFTVVMLGIWYAAIYNSHHYVLDVVAGILCGVTGIILFQTFIVSSERVRSLFNKLLYRIT